MYAYPGITNNNNARTTPRVKGSMVGEYLYDSSAMTLTRTYVNGPLYTALDISVLARRVDAGVRPPEMSRGDERVVMRDHDDSGQDYYYLPLTHHLPRRGNSYCVTVRQCLKRCVKGLPLTHHLPRRGNGYCVTDGQCLQRCVKGLPLTHHLPRRGNSYCVTGGRCLQLCVKGLPLTLAFPWETAIGFANVKGDI